MKKLNLTEQKGIAQIFLLVGMLLVAISLPFATKLVQQNQENRSNAAIRTSYVCYKGNAQGAKATGTYTSMSICKSKCSGGACKTISTVTNTKPICTWTTSGWSVCNNGKKTRTVTMTSSSDCSGGVQPAKTSTDGCTQNSTSTCTWTCNAWTTCDKNGKQYCNSQTKSPSGCTGGTSITSRPCTYTAPKTCTYTCNSWGLCNSTGKKYCYSQTASPSGCTGGTKITSTSCTYNASTAKTTYYYNNGTSCVGKVFDSPDACQATTNKTCYTSKDSCGSATTKTTYYHYSSSAKVCYGVSYSSISACSAAYGNCYTSKDSCDSAHKTVPCVSLGGTCDVTCNYGTFNNATDCSGSTPYCCASKTTSTCATSGGFCTYDAAGCTTSKGKINDGMGCSGGEICCTGVNSGVKGNLYYFYNSGSCQTTSVYSSLADCSTAKGACFDTKAACDSAKHTYFYYSESVKSCIGITYASLADCNKVLGTCYVTKAQCERVGLCGIAASDNRDHYPVSNHCIAGATYNEASADKEGKDGYYNWTCTKNGVTNECKAGTKKSGSGGGGGGSDSGYYYAGFSVNPKTLKLKVGESATATATESVTWSSDKADIATVTADGIVTGVAVGTATVTATNTSGETANVAVTVIASDARTLSFKIAFAGIKPVYINSSGTSYNCLGSLGTMTVEVLNRPTNNYEKFSDVPVSVKGNEVDSKGNQIFEVDNLEVGSSLAGVNTFNYVKIKGPFHLKRRMCQDGQSGKLDETTTCDINLGKTDGVPYDFSEYTLLAGDVDTNGVINSVDFSLVKNAVDADAEPECGRTYDLNMDGVVNSLDLSLVKDSLSSIDDE